MKLKTSNKTVIEEFEHDCGDGITFHETRTNGEITGQYFTNKFCQNRDEGKKQNLYYFYFPNLSSFIDNNELMCYNHDQDFYDYILDHPTIDIEAFSEWENVYCWDSYSGFLFHIWKEEPIAKPIYCDYIGGYTNKHYDLKKCFDHLAKNPKVSNLEIEEIPSYNSDFNGHAGLKYFYLPDQDELDMLYHKYKKEEFWSCRIKEEFNTHYRAPLDLLGLQQFKLKEMIEGRDF